MISSFIIYLSSLLGSVFAFKKARLHFRHGQYLYAFLLLTAGIVAVFSFVSNKADKIYAQSSNSVMFEPNKPLGTGKGIFPGRVVWVFDPQVANWDGGKDCWWTEENLSQGEIIRMLSVSLTSLTGQKDEIKAWDKLFRHFNLTKKGINQGYRKDQKIAIKINQNNTLRHKDTCGLNASPQMVYALLLSLTKAAGVPQKNITVFDASRFISDNIFNKCHQAFPEVLFVDNVGGEGRIKATYVDNAIPYSMDNGQLANGLASCAVEADYLIDMALLKGHIGQGVTLCAKNFYGATSINWNYRKNAHNNFNPDRSGKPHYMTFVDFLGHKDLGGKTLLFMIDGIYGARSQDGPPLIKDKWKMEPFDGRWPSSLFVSQDGVAIDAVGIDFLRSEWPDLRDLSFCDQYLKEAALAHNPPSKTVYDPERDHIACKSLGVMEHWNNSKEKKYSRNLGKKKGIELVFKPVHLK